MNIWGDQWFIHMTTKQQCLFELLDRHGVSFTTKEKQIVIDLLNRFYPETRTCMNRGEKGEIITVQQLYQLSLDSATELLEQIFGPQANQGIEVLDVDTLTTIESIDQIKKSKSINKCDCAIRMLSTGQIWYLSIKCKNCAMPAILNHTPRSAICFRQGGDLFPYLNTLDQIIKQMNTLRYDGVVGEDIHVSKIELTAEQRIGLINVVKYFAFIGTGSRKAKYACNSVLEVMDPRDPSQWTFFPCDSPKDQYTYIDSIYDHLILSMRDKGMPTKHCKICEPWIFYQDDQGKEKGSLHIRVRK